MKNRIIFKKRYFAAAVVLIAGLLYLYLTVPFGSYVFLPEKDEMPVDGKFFYDVPLDRSSPWPRFRANSLQNGRVQVKPSVDAGLRPWKFQTGKGIFSSPVIGADGTVYIGSADHFFYAIDQSGRLKWKVQTGEIIDSSALLDDRGRLYFGSGDGKVYALERKDGTIVWTAEAHSVEDVEREFGVKTYNVNWFEGNVGMLSDGTIIAPNDNYLVYEIDRDNGNRKHQYVVNEMIWSLPAVNTSTNRIFFGTQYMAFKNVFSFDTESKRRVWSSGGFGSNAASPLLTSRSAKGAVIIGGYDGYVRAYAQDSGKQLWKRGVRDHIYSSPAQLSDGTIIQPSADGTVYALEPSTGRVIWAYDTLEPIRSSPAVDGDDNIYVGSGEGRLFCINPDGTLRWSYLCIDENRNDLNSSPALGYKGVYIAGENGGVFFVPWDYPLTPAGRNDPRCDVGPGEKLPAEGAFMVFTERFGGLTVDAPEVVDANQPLAFTLFVREKGDTVKTAIDPDSIKISISGNPSFRTDISANRQFLVLTPQETWTSKEGGKISVSLEGKYITGMRRIGLKFFGGKADGSYQQNFDFRIPAFNSGKMPYYSPERDGGRSTVFELSRLAAPNPTMLPSWNQIGFDSLHYLTGVVQSGGSDMLVWVIGGKLHNGSTVGDPELEVRYPLNLRYDGGLVTLYNYDGFKINFIGSWDMPFGFYRISGGSDPLTGRIKDSPALGAIALGDDVEFYGRFLKLMGMTEFDTGHMAVFGGLDMKLYGRGYSLMPEGVGNVNFSAERNKVSAQITGGGLKAGSHVYSLVLVDPDTGRALPLYYTRDTVVTPDERGVVKSVSVLFNPGEVKGKVKAYFMIDTYPAASAEVVVKP